MNVPTKSLAVRLMCKFIIIFTSNSLDYQQIVKEDPLLIVDCSEPPVKILSFITCTFATSRIRRNDRMRKTLE